MAHHISPLALSTLNRAFASGARDCAADRPLTVPPVLQVDAIWVTQLLPTGGHRLDRKGAADQSSAVSSADFSLHWASGQRQSTPKSLPGVWPTKDEGDWLVFSVNWSAGRPGRKWPRTRHPTMADPVSVRHSTPSTLAPPRTLPLSTNSAISAMPFALTTTSFSAKENAAAALRSCATSVTSGMPNSSTTVLNAFAQLSRYCTTRNQQPSVVCAPDFRTTIAYFTALQRHQTGTAVSCAPPVGSSDSTVESAAQGSCRCLSFRCRPLLYGCSQRVSAFKPTNAHTRISTT